MKKIKIRLSPQDYYTFSEAFDEDGRDLKAAVDNILVEYAEMLRQYMEDYPDFREKEYRIKLHLSVSEMK